MKSVENTGKFSFATLFFYTTVVPNKFILVTFIELRLIFVQKRVHFFIYSPV